ncbi:MAG: hypothetical protein KDD66_13275 [Bdellovibrionales bacterium]|nr:hypothetical protein [Bdellovibrionales bacterium]
MKRSMLLAFVITLFFTACLDEPIPQGLHQESGTIGDTDVLGEWVKYNDLGEEEYRIVFNDRRSFDIYYYRHKLAQVWGMYERSGGKLSLRYLGGDVGYQCREPGKYTTGRVEDELLVTLVSDSCMSRIDIMQGVWRESAPVQK